MNFYEVIRKRRSTRRFKTDPVSRESLDRILEAGRWAPSASNLQPWRFIVITDADIKDKIAEICTESSKKAWKDFSVETTRYLRERGGTPNKSYMKGIPVLITVCYEVPSSLSHDGALASTWTAIENMLLAATEENLASCPYTLHDSREENILREILHIPQQYHIAAIIQLGYPSIYPPFPSRKKIEEIVSYQHF